MSFQKRKPYRPRIPFSEWYPKLKNMEVGKTFTTIRFIDKYDYYMEIMTSGTEVDIFMTPTEETIARCVIEKIDIITIYDLTEEIVKADTYEHWTILDMRKLLEKFYHRKSDWNGKNSRFILITLMPQEITFETSWQPMFREPKEEKK